MEEIWKPIEGYQGLYEVSNMGNVRSLKRTTTKGKILKQATDKDGYKKVSLSKNNIRKGAFVHRLVATTFIDKQRPEYIVVNHINEDKSDNRASNLEWCTIKYNTNYNGATYRRMLKRRTPIYAVKGDERIYFPAITIAAKALGVSHGNIIGCLNNVYGRKTLKGYMFEYADKARYEKGR